MLLLLAEALTPVISGFNALTYLTLRAILGALTALAISLLLGPALIRRLTQRQIGQTVRDDGPQSHLQKAGTPTMGGTLILLAILVSTLLWADLRSLFVWIVVGVTMAYGLLGFADDYRKLILKNPKGLSARQKLFWQLLVAIGVGVILFLRADSPQSTALLIPVLQGRGDPLGLGLHSIRLRRDRGDEQCREPDRWPGRSRHHADRAGGRRPRDVCLGCR